MRAAVLDMPSLAFDTLVCASHNPGKIAELLALLAPLNVSVVPAIDRGCPEPEENGRSFAENAQIKAVSAAIHAGLPALADDSGLVIPALGGAPGVLSARWAGPEKDYAAAFERIRQSLWERGAAAQPSAYFESALCLALPDSSNQHFAGRVYGKLVFPPRGKEGFGYDPIFVPEGSEQTFAEMNAEAKNRISHRARATAKFLAFLHDARLAHTTTEG